MAKKDLDKKLREINAEIRKSKEFRKVTDRRSHTFYMTKAGVKKEIETQVLDLSGRKDINPKLQEAIDKAVDIFYAKMVEGINRKVELSSNLVEYEKWVNATSYKIHVYHKKDINTTRNIYNIFKKAKTVASKEALTVLNKQLKAQKLQEIQGGNFLDIGHAKGSSVAEKFLTDIKNRLATFSLFNDKTNMVPTGARKIYGRIIADLERLSAPNSTTVRVTIEASSVNRTKGATLEKDLKDEGVALLQEAISQIRALDWAEMPGSDSHLTVIEKGVFNILAPLRKNKNIKTDIKHQKINTKPRTKASTINIPVYSTEEGIPKEPRQKARELPESDSPVSLARLIPQFNARLPEVVKRNMKEPGLVNRTGQFAESVEVLEILKTRKGFPSIGYTYDKNPYQVFEVGRGRAPWATPERDPRTVIEFSIREIAAGLMGSRFYMRRI